MPVLNFQKNKGEGIVYKGRSRLTRMRALHKTDPLSVMKLRRAGNDQFVRMKMTSNASSRADRLLARLERGKAGFAAPSRRGRNALLATAAVLGAGALGAGVREYYKHHGRKYGRKRLRKPRKR